MPSQTGKGDFALVDVPPPQIIFIAHTDGQIITHTDEGLIEHTG